MLRIDIQGEEKVLKIFVYYLGPTINQSQWFDSTQVKLRSYKDEWLFYRQINIKFVFKAEFLKTMSWKEY